MSQQYSVTIRTSGRGFLDLTGQVRGFVRDSGVRTGLCHVFLRHTSASLCLTENADPQVRADLERWMQRAVPDGDPLFRHDEEGPDDMPAHVRNLLAGYELTVPVRDGELALGTWQGIYVWEHRHRGHARELIVTILGGD